MAPITAPLIRGGAVAIANGRILAVGSARTLLAQHPDADVTECGQSLILPGLINAHTHLELSTCIAGESSEGTFAEWILSIRSRMQNPDTIAATNAGVEQCLRFGVTCVGDITQRPAMTRPVLAASPLRAVSYGEVLGLGAFRHRFDELFPPAVDSSLASSKLTIGLTPHAPYTVDMDGYGACLSYARAHRMPLATHLAENPEEREFLQSSTGPFRWAWEQLGIWKNGTIPNFSGGPIRLAQEVGLLDYPTLLAHVNYCDDDEMKLLSQGRATIVYCPRTHRYFGHPPHRWREMLSAGINVAVGTDSCASSPDLNLLAELRLLRHIAPDLAAEKLWEMATIRPAVALRLEQVIGSLEADKFADLVVVPVKTDHPLDELLSGDALPRDIWIDGKKCSGSVAA